MKNERLFIYLSVLFLACSFYSPEFLLYTQLNQPDMSYVSDGDNFMMQVNYTHNSWSFESAKMFKLNFK